MEECLPTLAKKSSVFGGRTVILVQWIHFHLSTPESPRSCKGTCHCLPSIVRCSVRQIAQMAFSFSLSTLDRPACLEIDLALDSIGRKGVLDGQSSGLHLGSLLGVDGLIDSFFDSMGYCRVAMAFEKNDGVVWLLHDWFGGGSAQWGRKGRPNFGVDEACRSGGFEGCGQRRSQRGISDE